MSCSAPAGGAGGPPPPVDAAVVDITDRVDGAKAFALNFTGPGSAATIFTPGSRSVMFSDADSQMIVFAPFKETVKIFSVQIDSGDAGDAPLTLRLYVNRPALGFEDCEDAKGATQSISIKASDAGKEIKLLHGKFSAVNTLYVFLDREGSDRCGVRTMRFRGVPVQSADVSKIKKSG